MYDENFEEECLRKLMVYYRTKIEKQEKVDEIEVINLLRIVREYGKRTADMRYIDCIDYFMELGYEI